MIPSEILLRAYRKGIFPMAKSATGPIEGYSANPRGIIDFADVHYSKRFLRVIRKGNYEIRINNAFEEVMRGCANRNETWISEDIVESFVNLHQLGHAHSVETWSLSNELIGGLYGVALKGAFFGESMFHEKPDASKIALYTLIERLKSRGYVLLDIQMVTPVTYQFGASQVTREEYKTRLNYAMTKDCSFI
ncbi:MAG: leucyl/phenylalanyl-tRNA--protein transferase [Candidatus Hodarchaeales archaeon]|jgi:leucyl/phenylalanyl-tRNA--protein transferase